MANVAFIVVLVVLFILVAVVFPRWGIRRTIPSVIQIFRHRNAVGKDNARTIDELGLRPARKGVLETMFGPRDYRLAALGHLVKAKVVQITEDRKLYLSEEDLAASKWKGH
jgi:hypothetical protein